MKSILVSGIVILTLAAVVVPAIAAPAPSVAARNVAIELNVRDGADARTYQLTAMVADEPTCTKVRDRTATASTDIDLCVRRSAGTDVQLDVQWRSESGKTSFETHTSALVAAGAPLELGGAARRLAITVK